MSIFRTLLLKMLSHHTLALLRWDWHFIKVRAVNFLFLNERRLNKKIAKMKHPLYLNLGSGPRGLASNNWVNVDGYMDTNVAYCMDFNNKLPFPDNCFEGIFCEHVLEHFNLENGQKLLHECFRVLSPGGCLRIIVPDGEKVMNAYFNNPTELLERRGVDMACAMEAVNSYFRQRYEHQIAYDGALLSYQFSQAGFTQVSRASFGIGKVSSPVIIDDKKYEWESLYMEAVKPLPGKMN